MPGSAAESIQVLTIVVLSGASCLGTMTRRHYSIPRMICSRTLSDKRRSSAMKVSRRTAGDGHRIPRFTDLGVSHASVI